VLELDVEVCQVLEDFLSIEEVAAAGWWNSGLVSIEGVGKQGCSIAKPGWSAVKVVPAVRNTNQVERSETGREAEKINNCAERRRAQTAIIDSSCFQHQETVRLVGPLHDLQKEHSSGNGSIECSDVPGMFDANPVKPIYQYLRP